MLLQCWSSAVGAVIETTLGQILMLAELHTGVCLHPPPPPPQYIRQLIRVLLAGQPANHKLTTILEIESGGDMTSAVCKF